jgi:spore coat polysaccharide biosynthesis predicted glycosyltransferase SpsG
MKKKNKIIIFSEFSKKKGFGHYVRSRRLFDHIKNKFKTKYYLNKNKNFVKKILKQSNYEKILFIFDLKNYNKYHILKNNNPVIYFDNKINFGRNSININPLFSPYGKFSGPKWHLYPKDFFFDKVIKKKRLVKNILICQGGTDPHNNIIKLVKNIKNKINDLDFKINILLPKNYVFHEKLKKNFSIKLYKNVNKLSSFLSNFDHIITACGNLSYEINFLGINCTYVTREKRELYLAKYLKKKGFGNFFYNPSDKKLKKHIYEQLLLPNQTIKKLKIKKIRYFRHNGLMNIEKLILKLLNEI